MSNHMKYGRFIKNINSGRVYHYSEILAERSDHIECDFEGTPVPSPESESSAALTPKKSKAVTRTKAKKASDPSDVGEGAYSGTEEDKKET